MNVRAEHTRSLLQGALLRLAGDRRLEEVTISEIVEEAGVNRSSFYQHYDDKHTLLADALERTIDDLVPGDLPHADLPAGGIPPQLWLYLEHIATHAGVYRQMLSDHGSTVVVARLATRIGGILTSVIEAKNPSIPPELPVRVLAASSVGSLIGVLAAWISQEQPQPVETVARWIEVSLITPANTWLSPAADG